VDGAGFEPAASAPNLVYQNKLNDSEIEDILEKFSEWLEVDELRKPRAIQHNTQWIRSLFSDVRICPPTKEDFRSFLKKWKRNKC